MLALIWLVVVAWVVSHGLARGALPAWPVASVAGVALAVATALAARLAAVPAFDLHWDGRSWAVALPTSTAVPGQSGDPCPGDVVVAVDLGDWLLLRFVPERLALPPTGAVPRWLPLQRAGLEPAWHALRCAVHSPRPAAASADTPTG